MENILRKGEESFPHISTALRRATELQPKCLCERGGEQSHHSVAAFRRAATYSAVHVDLCSAGADVGAGLRPKPRQHRAGQPAVKW